MSPVSVSLDIHSLIYDGLQLDTDSLSRLCDVPSQCLATWPTNRCRNSIQGNPQHVQWILDNQFVSQDIGSNILHMLGRAAFCHEHQNLEQELANQWRRLEDKSQLRLVLEFATAEKKRSWDKKVKNLRVFTSVTIFSILLSPPFTFFDILLLMVSVILATIIIGCMLLDLFDWKIIFECFLGLSFYILAFASKPYPPGVWRIVGCALSTFLFVAINRQEFVGRSSN